MMAAVRAARSERSRPARSLVPIPAFVRESSCVRRSSSGTRKLSIPQSRPTFADKRREACHSHNDDGDLWNRSEGADHTNDDVAEPHDSAGAGREVRSEGVGEENCSLEVHGACATSLSDPRQPHNDAAAPLPSPPSTTTCNATSNASALLGPLSTTTGSVFADQDCCTAPPASRSSNTAGGSGRASPASRLRLSEPLSQNFVFSDVSHSWPSMHRDCDREEQFAVLAAMSVCVCAATAHLALLPGHSAAPVDAACSGNSRWVELRAAGFLVIFASRAHSNAGSAPLGLVVLRDCRVTKTRIRGAAGRLLLFGRKLPTNDIGHEFVDGPLAVLLQCCLVHHAVRLEFASECEFNAMSSALERQQESHHHHHHRHRLPRAAAPVAPQHQTKPRPAHSDNLLVLLLRRIIAPAQTPRDGAPFASWICANRQELHARHRVGAPRLGQATAEKQQRHQLLIAHLSASFGSIELIADDLPLGGGALLSAVDRATGFACQLRTFDTRLVPSALDDEALLHITRHPFILTVLRVMRIEALSVCVLASPPPPLAVINTALEQSPLQKAPSAPLMGARHRNLASLVGEMRALRGTTGGSGELVDVPGAAAAMSCVFAQLTLAIGFLHSRGVVAGCLHPSRVLLVEHHHSGNHAAGMHILVTGIGLFPSMWPLQNTAPSVLRYVSPRYGVLAVAALEAPGVSMPQMCSADDWGSLAALAFELTVGAPLFRGETAIEVLHSMQVLAAQIRLHQGASVHTAVREFVDRRLNEEAGCRRAATVEGESRPGAHHFVEDEDASNSSSPSNQCLFAELIAELLVPVSCALAAMPADAKGTTSCPQAAAAASCAAIAAAPNFASRIMAASLFDGLDWVAIFERRLPNGGRCPLKTFLEQLAADGASNRSTACHASAGCLSGELQEGFREVLGLGLPILSPTPTGDAGHRSASGGSAAAVPHCRPPRCAMEMTEAAKRRHDAQIRSRDSAAITKTNCARSAREPDLPKDVSRPPSPASSTMKGAERGRPHRSYYYNHCDPNDDPATCASHASAHPRLSAVVAAIHGDHDVLPRHLRHVQPRYTSSATAQRPPVPAAPGGSDSADGSDADVTSGEAQRKAEWQDTYVPPARQAAARVPRSQSEFGEPTPLYALPWRRLRTATGCEDGGGSNAGCPARSASAGTASRASAWTAPRVGSMPPWLHSASARTDCGAHRPAVPLEEAIRRADEERHQGDLALQQRGCRAARSGSAPARSARMPPPVEALARTSKADARTPRDARAESIARGEEEEGGGIAPAKISGAAVREIGGSVVKKSDAHRNEVVDEEDADDNDVVVMGTGMYSPLVRNAMAQPSTPATARELAALRWTQIHHHVDELEPQAVADVAADAAADGDSIELELVESSASPPLGRDPEYFRSHDEGAGVPPLPTSAAPPQTIPLRSVRIPDAHGLPVAPPGRVTPPAQSSAPVERRDSPAPARSPFGSQTAPAARTLPRGRASSTFPAQGCLISSDADEEEDDDEDGEWHAFPTPGHAHPVDHRAADAVHAPEDYNSDDGFVSLDDDGQ